MAVWLVAAPKRWPHPVGLVAQHQMDTGRRHRQGAVDCRSKRMDQIRPFWCVHPQCARAARAEMALSGAGPAAAILFQLGAVDAAPFATPALQAPAVGRSEEHTS